MAGYRPVFFFFLRFYGPRQNVKKEQGHYPAILTEQAWSMKDLLYGQKIHHRICFCGNKARYPERAR